ncbi:BCL-6 corepressor-like protein 1 isoform X2 [Hyperolius riggenbachi]|uniref:BCL-6 corepressor-like protein 1 isoform X2 n=1 Tax=Hyperolius riggenbachi TaxID=752182 RepID=UPI0035A2AC41
MISAAPLYSGVHNWSSAERVRMCGIEDRRTALSDEETRSPGVQCLRSDEHCVTPILSKVDITPTSNQSDVASMQKAGGVQVVAGQPLEEKPPDPATSQPVRAARSSKASAKTRASDAKHAAKMLDTNIQAVSSKHGKKGESVRSPAQEKAAAKDPPTLKPANTDPPAKQKAILCPGLQMSGQPVEATHAVASSSYGTLAQFAMSRICFSATQVPNMPKLPLSFPSNAVLTPSQPLVYIPPANCGQPISVATLPTTFGVTSTLTLPMLPTCLPEQCLIQSPSEMHTHTFTTSLGRTLTADPKMTSAELKKPASTTPTFSLTSSNSIIPSTVDSSPTTTDTTSSALTALQTLPMVSVSPIALTTYARTPSNLETQSDSSSSSVSPLKSPPQLEREMVSPPDTSEMPLDLSSKSHRHKHAPSNQRKTPPMPVLTPVHTSGKASLSTVLSRSDCTSQRLTPNTSSSVNPTLRGAPLVMFPEFLRNGDPGSPQLASASWIKNSAALISTIPGTYVGVANPVPASVLLNKDSNLSLSPDTRHLAKQEPISIIDQGEPKNSGSCGKKSSQTTIDDQQLTDKRHLVGRVATVNSVCPSKDWTLSGHGTVLPKCPLNGKPNSQVLPVSWSPYHQASLLSIGIPPSSTLHSNQGSPHRLPVTEFTLFNNLLKAESNTTPQSPGESALNSQLKSFVPTGTVMEQDTLAKTRTCETLSKQQKSHSNKTLLAPKPTAGNNILYPQPGVADRTDCSLNPLRSPDESPLLNKISDKANCKDDKLRPKLTYSRKPFGDAKPKNKVLASYMTNDQLTTVQPKDSSGSFPLLEKDSSAKDFMADVSQDEPPHRKRSHKKAPAVEPAHCVQEVDLSKVKIERIDDDEECFGRFPTFNNSSWSPIEMPPITKVKARVKKEPGLRGRAKLTEDITPTKSTKQKYKCKTKKEDLKKISQQTPKRKWKRSASPSPDKKQAKAAKARKEVTVGRMRRRRRRIKTEPIDPELDLGTFGFSDMVSSCAEPFPTEEEEKEEDPVLPAKRRRGRRPYKTCRTRTFACIKEEPEAVPITPVLRHSWDISGRGVDMGKSSVVSEPEDEEDGTLRRRKRRRQKNRKYQNGEYLTEKEEEEVSQCFRQRRSRTGSYKRKQSPDRISETLKVKNSPSSRDNQRLNSRAGDSTQPLDKPPGKRKCKTKHLGGATEGERKGRGRRSFRSPKSSPVKSPQKSSEPSTPHRSRRGSTLYDQQMPPEARKLIVNKNAGETLLQRAARLGYKDVVLYCLQRDPTDVNHRDNAGYTALHEACARGWTEILQILLDNGANVNCSAQDGTRPIHDAVVNDNLETVWLLLSYGADPTLATYSGQTPLKLANSDPMRTFLTDYLSDLRGRTDGDPRTSWDFYSSAILDAKDEVSHDVLLFPTDASTQEKDGDNEEEEEDNFLFEFSDTPLIPCYNLQVSLSTGPGNWFLISDVLKRLKLSSRIFQARYPHFEIASMQKKAFTHQVFSSQILTPSEGADLWPQDSGETVELIRYDPELMRLLGSSVEFQSASS